MFPALIRRLVALVAFAAVAAGASSAELFEHSFSFDTLKDDQDAEVIDYRYGTSTLPVHAPEWAVTEGKALTFNRVSGAMVKGDSLYVKWRIKSTGQVYEDTVDLRQRLPADISHHRIHFMVRGPQLYVYLITPERRSSDTPPNGPRMYRYLKTITIYPDLPPSNPTSPPKGAP
jgi:hypothetical protein